MSTDKKSRQWYEDNADNYAAHTRDPNESIYHSLYEKPAMYSMLPDLTGMSVLSLGCGSGEDCNYLQAHGAKNVTGIDLSANLIEIASKSYPECQFKVMDMEQLDFSDESFEFAYSSLAMHYIEDWSQIFREVYRVLKPNSYFLFSCNHPVETAMDITQNDDANKMRQLSRSTNKTTGDITIVGDYMARKSSSDATDFEVTTWHKPVGEISSEAVSAGFLIAGIHDPKPLERMREVSPGSFEVLSKIPCFMMIKLIKI